MPTIRLSVTEEQVAEINQRCGNTKTLIARLWYVTLLFSIINVITSFSVLSGTSAESGFTAIWSMFMTVSVALGGTAVFRKYQTPGAVGFLLGVICMMCQLFFLLFVVFLSFAGSAEYGSSKDTDRAYAAFAFLLMICYGVMAFVIAQFRADLLPGEKGAASATTSATTPPASVSV